jgi:two-component system chemotaxis response regulator CheY
MAIYPRQEKSMSVRVLMVDDSLFVRDVLRHHLECMGCEVVAEAANTGQALDLYRTVKPALVTLDVSVPRTGGIGALALFRVIRLDNPQIPILIISEIAFPEIRKSFLREGALDYLMKPFEGGSFVKVCGKLSEIFPELNLVAQQPRYATAAANRRLPYTELCCAEDATDEPLFSSIRTRSIVTG